MSTIKSSAENLTLNADGANNDVIIQSNGSTKVTVDGATGKVGIGTSSPAEELDISADAPAMQLSSTNASGRNYGLQSTNNGGFSFYDGTAGLERMRIDSAGRVTMPYQPSFDAYVTNSSATFTSTVIIFNGISTHNIGSHYNTANGRFTVPVAGRYFFTYNAQKNGTLDTDSQTQFQKNGAKVNDSHVVHTAKANHASQSVVWQLAANDYVDVKAVTGTIKGDYTHFSGHLLG